MVFIGCNNWLASSDRYFSHLPPDARPRFWLRHAMGPSKSFLGYTKIMRKVRKLASGNRVVGELTLFSVLGVIACGTSFFAYWWLAVVGLILGARGWMLSYHKAAQQL